MNKATCPNCGHNTLGFRYRSERSPLPKSMIRCSRCGFKKGDALPTKRIMYKTSSKIRTIAKDRADELVRKGNAVYA
jgi:C4-type Zn-finger protein